jgi:hypothetical protein
LKEKHTEKILRKNGINSVISIDILQKV